jgi:hypothetical protein
MAAYLLHRFGKFPGASDRIEAEGGRRNRRRAAAGIKLEKAA